MQIDKKLLGLAMLRAGVKSGRELADLAGLSESTVSRMNNGGKVSQMTLERLAEALDVEPEELLAGEG